MHQLFTLFLWWALLGSLIPAAIIAGPVFVSTRGSFSRKLWIGITCGPAMWTILIAAVISGMVMKAIHSMRNGKPLVPPASAPRGKG